MHPDPKGWKKFQKKPVVVLAQQIDTPFSFKTCNGDENGQAGDFLMVDQDGIIHIRGKERFERDYGPATKGAKGPDLPENLMEYEDRSSVKTEKLPGVH